MDPHKVYRKVVYEYIESHARCIGHHVTDLHFKTNARTYISLALWNSAIIMALYTASTGDPEVALTNLFFALLGTQVFL